MSSIPLLNLCRSSGDVLVCVLSDFQLTKCKKAPLDSDKGNSETVCDKKE